MIINFLQTRDPPVLPSLQQSPGLKPRSVDGLNVTFDKNIAAYEDFGKRNESSLAQLLFQFFCYYGHEVNYEENVMSVRLGRLLPKRQKGWHQLQDNRLCVEEPFNTSRNLGNTADDTSMRGIHMELRLAFDHVAAGDLEACCAQFEPPIEDGKLSEIFVPPVSRPVITQPPTQPAKLQKGAGRGGRHAQTQRVGNSGNRRSSNNPGTRGSGYLRNLPFQMTPQDMQLQNQHRQHLLHDHLFQQYQYLQAQEQELRMQLHQQALMQGRLPQTMAYPHIAFPAFASQDERYGDNSSSRASSGSRAPMSAPLHQQQFAYASPYLPQVFPVALNGSTPPSPSLTTNNTASRRYNRRSSASHLSAGSLRAHSQPARPLQLPQSITPYVSTVETVQSPQGLPQSASSMQDYLRENVATRPAATLPQVHNARRPAEYMGWFIGHSPSVSVYSRSAGISPIPSHVGLAIRNGGLSPRPVSSESGHASQTASPPVEAYNSNNAGAENNRGRSKIVYRSREPAHSLTNPASTMTSTAAKVNGVTRKPNRQSGFTTENVPEPGDVLTFSTTTSEDLAFDTPSSSDDQSQTEMHQNGHAANLGLGVQDSGDILSKHAGGVGGAEGSEKPFYLPDHLVTTPAVNGNYVPISSGHASDSLLNGHGTSLPHEAMPFNRIRPFEHLAPVTEVRTPSPSQSSTKLLAGKSALPVTVNGISTASSQAIGGTSAAPPALGENEAPVQISAWQMQKKRKKAKRGTKSEADVSVFMTAPEQLPLDQDLRKGG